MITVHHLNHSRSQRVLWMLEELGVPYEVKRYERDAQTMLAPPFPVEAAVARGGLDSKWPKLGAYLARIHARPAYQRAIEVGGPFAVLG